MFSNLMIAAAAVWMVFFGGFTSLFGV